MLSFLEWWGHAPLSTGATYWWSPHRPQTNPGKLLCWCKNQGRVFSQWELFIMFQCSSPECGEGRLITCITAGGTLLEARRRFWHHSQSVCVCVSMGLKILDGNLKTEVPCHAVDLFGCRVSLRWSSGEWALPLNISSAPCVRSLLGTSDLQV